MATFQASATSPTCAYNESAEMPDAAFEAILAAARKRFGKVPTDETGADGQPVMRDTTNEETVKRMLGSFLLGWRQNVIDDVREAANAANEAAIKAAAPDWTVGKV